MQEVLKGYSIDQNAILFSLVQRNKDLVCISEKENRCTELVLSDMRVIIGGTVIVPMTFLQIKIDLYSQ